MNKLIKILKLLHSGTDVGSGLSEPWYDFIEHEGHAINIRHTRDQNGSHHRVTWCETCEARVDKNRE